MCWQAENTCGNNIVSHEVNGPCDTQHTMSTTIMSDCVSPLVTGSTTNVIKSTHHQPTGTSESVNFQLNVISFNTFDFNHSRDLILDMEGDVLFVC